MPLASLRVPMLPKDTTCPAFAQSITAKSIFCLSTARRLRRGSEVELRRPGASRGGLSQDRLVEFRISEEPLQPGILLLKVLQPLRLVDPQPTELLLPRE
jgi:hypothetical protein